MIKLKSIFKTSLIIIIALTMLANLFIGCTAKNTDTTMEDISGDSEDIINALNSDQLTQEERESLAQQLLKNYSFYQGRVTVVENQKWTSRGSDLSSGFGDTTLSTDEILVYDKETQKTYIISRYMSCTGWHRVTVNDMHGNYIQDCDIVHSGELYEYYGTGLLWKKTLDVASASDSVISRYTLNFAANPVRMDNSRSVIFTYPLPRQIDWVTYVSIAGTDRRGGIRMWPPEENTKNTELDLVPTLTNISDSNTYNQNESWLYEATDRIWIPSGTFSYDYYQISYEDAMSEIERLRQETAAAGSFGAMAADQPPAWQETAALADELGATVSATQGVDAIVDSLLPQDVIDALQARNAADIITDEKAFQDYISTLDKTGAIMSNESDPGTPRSLEGVIIESSEESSAGPQQKNLKGNFNTIKPSLDGLYKKYTSIYNSLQQEIAQIKTLSSNPDFPVDRMTTSLQNCRQYIDEAVKLNQLSELLLADTFVILYDLNNKGSVDDETSYTELNKLFSLWEETFKFAENVSIDVEKGTELPEGYPANVIPIISGAVVAISERVPGEDGAGDGYNITLKSSLTIEEAVQYYENVLTDIPDVSKFSFGDVTTLSGEKDNYEFGIMVTKNNLGGAEKSLIQITLTPLE